MVRIGVLGPLLIHDGESPVSVPTRRQRILLAALLTNAGTTVPSAALAELIWDGSPPAGAATTLRSHVMRLRRALGPVAGERVRTRYPGYAIDVAEEELDLLRFAGLCRDGGLAVRDGNWTAAYQVLTDALLLWRGEPFADIASELLRRDEVPRLEQLRLQAADWRAQAGLRLGHHADLMDELQRLTEKYPLQERFHAHLMIAMARSGRRAEALAAYGRARDVLREELATEPGAELRELHQRILSADPALSGPKALSSPPADHRATVTPRELPAPVAHFVGRAMELAALTGILDRPGDEPAGAIVISAIGGTAGVGKTALAVRWAHHVAARFPDGQLHVNLRGYAPEQPMTAADALAGFLRSLGVSGKDVPTDGAERAARYRSLLSGRRMLVLLDNAASEEQVRPLLPASPGCAVVVTSRSALPGLVARDGAERLDLDPLPLADAVGLLRTLIGTRADMDREAATALAEQCCRLPLALRVAAEITAGRPMIALAEIAAELADHQRRLDLLEAGGDSDTGVRAVFTWSYRHLNADAARAFRLAALNPGPSFDRYALSALSDVPAEKADQILAVLARAHLIQPAGRDHYGMHDLLRAFARELAASQDGDDARHAALTRLFDYYVRAAAAAMDTLFPAETRRRLHAPAPAGSAPPMAGPAAARAWLDAQRANLVAVTVRAAGLRWTRYATSLSAILARYLENSGHFPEAVTVHTHARDAARHAGDQAGEASARSSLGLLAWWKGQYEQAAGHLRHALTLYRETADRSSQAYVLANLGIVMGQQCKYEQAAGYLRQGLALHRKNGDRTGEARALSNLGMVEEEQGRYAEATGLYRQSLILSRENGDRTSEAYALVSLGQIEGRLGEFDRATSHIMESLQVFRASGNRAVQPEVLGALGEIVLRQGDHERAARHYRQSLALGRELGNPAHEARARNGLGEALLVAGQPAEARTEHVAALDLAARIGQKHEQARAHDGLARSYHATGDGALARHHRREALALYTSLGIPEAGGAQERLAGTGSRD
jgi:DNA-binding SARP family transcriptional activator/tetratricopeptide (TPR) repeat protein